MGNVLKDFVNARTAGKALLVNRKPPATTSTTAQILSTGFVRGQINVAVMTDTLVVIAVLFQLALMCLIVLDEASVLIMTCANVIRSGLVKTVPSSLVDLSTIAPVMDAASRSTNVTATQVGLEPAAVSLIAQA